MQGWPKMRHTDVIIAREVAHTLFDMLWLLDFFPDRSKAYAWLAQFFGMPAKEAHIGRLNIEQCERLADACRQKLQAGVMTLRERLRCAPADLTPTPKLKKMKMLNELYLGALRRIAMEEIGTLPDGVRPSRRFIAQEALEQRVPILTRSLK